MTGVHPGGSRSLVRSHAASTRPTQHRLPTSRSDLAIAAPSSRTAPGQVRAGGPGGAVPGPGDRPRARAGEAAAAGGDPRAGPGTAAVGGRAGLVLKGLR
jgi:hypothetical protein